MIDLLEEQQLWEFCAQHNAFISHVPGTDGLNNRFSLFTDQASINQLSSLGYPRMELHSQPNGNIAGDNAWQYDILNRTLRVITKFEKNNFADKLAKQNACKAALVEIVSYITQSQQNDSCTSNIIKMFNPAAVTYQLIDNATADASFCGCQMKVQFKAPISQTPVTYGTFSYP